MQRVLRCLTGLIGMLLVAIGLTFLVAPARLTGQFAVPAIFKGPIVVGKDGMLVTLVPGGTAVTMRELLK